MRTRSRNEGGSGGFENRNTLGGAVAGASQDFGGGPVAAATVGADEEGAGLLARTGVVRLTRKMRE